MLRDSTRGIDTAYTPDESSLEADALHSKYQVANDSNGPKQVVAFPAGLFQYKHVPNKAEEGHIPSDKVKSRSSCGERESKNVFMKSTEANTRLNKA